MTPATGAPPDTGTDPPMAGLSARIFERIGDIDAAAWDSCAGADNPFVSHAYLKALEDSGSVSAERGLRPRHLVLHDGSGQVVAAAPLYLKNHALGEYGRDALWARHYDAHGGRYYPKLQVEVPFTPVAGPRLLARPGPARHRLIDALIRTLLDVSARMKVSSLHVAYSTAEEWQRLGAAGFLQRKDIQYHWPNRGYGDFSDFLAGLRKSRRTMLRRERREALAGGLGIDWLSGVALTPAHWDRFHSFYLDTNARKDAPELLNRAFFHCLGRAMADRVRLVLVRRGDEYLAGTLNMVGGDTLYIRYWGCVEQRKFLHFETTYYQAIDHAIENGLGRIDGGAGGPHKVARGFLPTDTYSAHWFRHSDFRRSVAQALARERHLFPKAKADFEARLPYIESTPRTPGSGY